MDWENWKEIAINNKIVLILGTLIGAFIVSMILRKILDRMIHSVAPKLHLDPTKFKFMKNSTTFIVFTLAIIFIFYNIPFLHNLGTAMFAGAGILAAIIGFASQKAFSNIVSGLFILSFKPFKVGDTIEAASNQRGVVEDITLRHTVIRNYENRRIIIPNSIISEESIINSSIVDQRIKKHMAFGISYDSSIDKAMAIIKDEVLKHPLFLDGRTEQEIQEGSEAVQVIVVGLSDFSVDLRANVWAANTDDSFTMNCDLLKSIKERFDREGIEIPFPYRTVVFKKDIP
ncbi:MAG: mechanosensitive ion channel family protein [Bacteroidales bacterium]|nr:mechanosensitive ion channel family protein [Bacteroidales bacterium]MCF8457167.1 mechanosensitive ion channel family protein [Bacteroidales bacterium]